MNTNALASMQSRESPESRSTQFVPVEGGGPQTTDAGTFMVYAYALMWLCTILFIFHTWRRMRGVQVRVEELQKAVGKLPHAGQ